VTMLGDVLELDRIQMASVTRVLEEETTKRHQLIIREARTGASDDAEWRRLGKKREGRLRLIFDSEQLRTYQLMIGTERDLIAQECQSRAMASHGR
jgi:hypothetical protein